MKQTETATWIIGVFLAGVLVQVFAALIYKVSMWYIYFAELYPQTANNKTYKIAVWLSEAIWLEVTFDLLTIGAYFWATFRVLQEYIAAAGP